MYSDSHSPLVMISHPHAQFYPQQHQQHLKMHYQNPNEYYMRPRQHQQQRIEVITLEEVPPPSRHSIPCSSSAASSSYYSSSEEEEESVSSYCSSDVPSDNGKQFAQYPASPQQRHQHQQRGMDLDSRHDDSINSRMRRVELWRDQYAKAVGAHFAPSPMHAKRKGADAENDEDDDTKSRSSKRSRPAISITSSVRSIHSCSACDACFDSRQSLRRHGRGPTTNEACRAAVEYGFE